MASRLEEIRNERITKLKKLVALGIAPYPAQSNKEVSNGAVIADFDKFDGQTVSLTGRLRALREHGKLAFGDLEDQSGKIQLLLRASNLKALDKDKGTLGFEELSLIDVGDFVESRGVVCKSKTGAISLDVQEFRLLTKSIRPLPDSWEGLKDADTIFRRRYLDLAINPNRRDLFIRKSKFWSTARIFMGENGFIEVETPVLEHVTGGADAKPFETHHNALDETFFMRISTELYQKRLLGGGFEKIYTLAPNFRNEGIDDEHLQEYYQLEWYWAYADFRDNMALTRDLFRRLAKDVYGTTKFTRQEHTFDLAAEWEEIDYATVILNKLGIDIFNDSEAQMANVLMKHGVKLDGNVGKSRLVDNLWKIIRKDVAGPAFLINVPKFISPLAKSYANNDALTERFQIILAGSELCNGYSELNDPVDQLARFMDQQSQRDAGDDEAQMLDIDYVEMLEYGMPPASGLGVSERLFWFLENVTAREGTLFPQMKRHVSQLTKNIYGIVDLVLDKKSKSNTEPSGFIDESVKEIFPGIFYAYTVIDNVDIKKSSPDLKKLTKEIVKNNTHELDEIGELKPIKGYREIFKKTGAWKLSRRPSPEALLRRLSTGKGIYNINTAVDAYNLAVIETGVGLGGFNMNEIAFPVTLRMTKAGEKMHLLGDDEPTTVLDGEVAYADTNKLITLDLNYRDINTTKIDESTKKIILYADGAPGLTEDEVVSSLQKGADYIKQFCGGTISDIIVVR